MEQINESHTYLKKEENFSLFKEWTTTQKIIFRIAFLFFGIFSIPWDFGFYVRLWHLDFAYLNYRHLNEVFNFYNPQFVNHYSESGFFGLYSYANYLVVLVVALVGGTIWTLLDKDRKEYNLLYYWVRTIAKYRVAYGIIAWGYKKIFVMQMPPLNEAILHTDFIDFFAKRLYWESISVSPAYEVFLGFAEFIPGFLLLFRKTTPLGAALSAVVLGNVAIANHTYDIGEQVPSASMAMLALFVLWYDLPSIWQLIVNEKDTLITRYYPTFQIKWQQYTKLAIKYTFNFVFVGLFFIFEVYAYTHNDFYKIPNTPGLKNAKGFYEVTEFKLNNKIVPYSPLDSLRWQDATFEEWSSLSFKVANRPEEIEMFAAASYPRRGEPYDNQWHITLTGDERRFSKREEKHDPEKRDINIKWEFSGLGSDRKWYHYKADTTNKILYLQNKNRYRKDQTQVLHYSRPTRDRIVLKGINEFKDSIYVVLDRSQRKSPLLEGRQSDIKEY